MRNNNSFDPTHVFDHVEMDNVPIITGKLQIPVTVSFNLIFHKIAYMSTNININNDCFFLNKDIITDLKLVGDIDLNNFVFPDGLKRLTIDIKVKSDAIDYTLKIPSSVTELTLKLPLIFYEIDFSEHQIEKLDITFNSYSHGYHIIPDGVKILILTENCRNSAINYILPQSLKELYIREGAVYYYPQIHFPDNIEILELPDQFLCISAIKLPENLKKLIIGQISRDFKISHYPETLESLIVKKSNKLPHNLKNSFIKYITLEKCKIDIKKYELPNTLINLY